MSKSDLLRSGPYRVFFPLSVLSGLLGVGHWLFWSMKVFPIPNPFFHASLQVEGFLGFAMVGFLTTALPRFLGVTWPRLDEIVVLVGIGLAYLGLALAGQWQWAYGCFILMLVATLVVVGRRFPERAKDPPASFLLVAFGLLHAVVGAGLLMGSRFGLRSLVVYEIGRSMLHIGFLLCLVLGIAGYLAPYLMGYAQDPSCQTAHSVVRGNAGLSLLFHGLVGVGLFGTFVLEPYSPRAAFGLRAVLATLHFCFFGKLFRRPRKRETYVIFFWISCWMVQMGLWGVWLFPLYRIAMLHILFIAGFSLMIFSFGMLVILSHGAQAQLLNTRLIPLHIVGDAVLVATLLRIMADLNPVHYVLWIHTASGTWVLAAFFWLVYIFPKLWTFPNYDSV